MPVARQRASAAQGVVHRHAGSDIRPLPGPMRQRIEERHRVDQMRSQPSEHQLTLTQSFADQGEVELLQITQPAMDELARPGRRSARDVARFHQGGGQPSARGVECNAGTGDPAPHDQDVEPVPSQSPPCFLARLRIEPRGRRHPSSSTQPKVRSTAFAHRRISRSRQSPSRDGSHRRSSAQCCRRSSSPAQNPTARPAA